VQPPRRRARPHAPARRRRPRARLARRDALALAPWRAFCALLLAPAATLLRRLCLALRPPQTLFRARARVCGPGTPSPRSRPCAQDAERCIAMQPKWSKGYSRLGLAKFKSGDLAGAMKAYSAGLALDAGNTQIADGLAEVRPSRARVRVRVCARARVCAPGARGEAVA
jgi:hypothetical protein